MMLMREARESEFWERIRTSPDYAEARAQLERFYSEVDGEMPVLSFQDFMDYARTGRRIDYEPKYFIRRGQLIAAAGMYFIFRESSYLHRLEDVIWAICDEYTWSLPAHVPWDKDFEAVPAHIDLFAAETGFALSEITSLLQDELHPRVCSRVKDEVQARIIRSFEENNWHWEKLEMNWSAVCAGSVGACFMYLFPERFEAVKPRLLSAMDCFLRGFGSDGCCREGMNYWNYGFGFFTYFSDLLYQFSDGAEDLFSDRRAQRAAQFQQAAFLNPAACISFADCAPEAKVVPGLLSYLIRRYPEEVYPAGRTAEILDRSDHCYRWAAFFRNLIWTDFQALTPMAYINNIYLSDAQWYISKEGPFTLAAKGGHNDEPHNHNDLGNFILADDAGQLLSDLGSGLYTQAYFHPETRYGIINNSAAGHSVPIIGGKLQTEGKDHAAKTLRADKTGFAVDIAGGYDVDGLKRVIREWSIAPDAIVMQDDFCLDGSPLEVTERFITILPPRIEENTVFLRSLRMSADAAPVVEKHEFLGHGGNTQNFYTIDYHIQTGCRFTVRFTQNDSM